MRGREVWDGKQAGRGLGRSLTVGALQVRGIEDVDGAAVWAAGCAGAEDGGIAFGVAGEGGGGGGERGGGEDRDDGGSVEMHGVPGEWRVEVWLVIVFEEVWEND